MKVVRRLYDLSYTTVMSKSPFSISLPAVVLRPMPAITPMRSFCGVALFVPLFLQLK